MFKPKNQLHEKINLYSGIFLYLYNLCFAGGLLTNTNQSAQFIRMMSRNASTEIDAVYFNPAGLIKMDDGWHFAVYSQTIFQDKPVDSKFPLLNDGYYKGEVKVSCFFQQLLLFIKWKNWAFFSGVWSQRWRWFCYLRYRAAIF